MAQSIRKIAVIGADAIGSQIASMCALAGFKVNVHDRDEDMFSKNMEGISQRLINEVDKGTLSLSVLEESFSHLVFEPDLESAVKDRDFIIEMINGNGSTNENILKNIDKHAPKHAILATNSSSKIADVTERPAQVCHVHLEPIEVVRSLHASDETTKMATEVMRQLEKTIPILLQKEVSSL